MRRKIAVVTTACLFAGGALAFGIYAVGRYVITPVETVEFRNDTTKHVELSCEGNDIPEIGPRATGSAEMGLGHREHCLVYDIEGAVYEGCLTVDTTVKEADPVRSSTHSTSTSISACHI